MPIGHSFIELASVDSTNNYAMAMASAGKISHGSLVFAREQWAGKGQRGRSWSSEPGENIILSVVIQPVPLSPTQSFYLSAAISLACFDLFSCYAGSDETSIKWPNDLYWRDRKAGGILIESSFKGEVWSLAVGGMGININQVEFPSAAPNPVSLRQITGQSFDTIKLARELGSYLDLRYRELEEGATDTLIEQYNQRLYKRGKPARLKKDNAIFETVVLGVSARGELLTRDVMPREFRWGEVEWVLPREGLL